MPANERTVDLSSPRAAVQSYIKAWRDNDPEAQWLCLKKVEPQGDQIQFFITDAISERWDFQRFQEEFPRLKQKYHDRYRLRYFGMKRDTDEKARVYYVGRRRDSILRSLPFFLSRWQWLVGLFFRFFNIYPWYDVQSYYDLVREGSDWLVADRRYYKY